MKLIKEIKSKDGVLHFRRWEILKTRWGSIWIHGIYKEDQDPYLHNHPWDFISVVLFGKYLEKTEDKFITQSFGKINVRDGSKYHKIFKLYTKSVYTLFIVSNVKREWGYNKDGEFISNENYRKLKNENNIKV